MAIDMKNILFVHYGDNWIRGSEVVLLDMLAAQIAHGRKPILWCNSQILATEAEKIGAQVIVDRFVCLGYWTSPKWDFCQFTRLLSKARKILTSENIDIVHCNNGGPCQWISLVCKFVKVKLILHLHARYQQRDRLTLLFHFADRIIGVSQSVVDIFQVNEYQKQRLALVHNGISSARVLSEQPFDIRAAVGARKNQPVVLYVGSLIPRKGLNMLIRSLAEVNQQHPLKAAIFGSGDEQLALNNLVKTLGLQDVVRFFPPEVEVARLYSSNADFFISTPTEEVFGLTLGEASLAGLPIISTCVAGVDEIYTDNENALLVPSGDRHRLSVALLRLIEQPALAQRLATNAQQHIKSHFSLQRQSMAIEKQYQLLQQSFSTSGCITAARISLLFTKLCLLKLVKTIRILSIRLCKYG